MSKLCIVSEYEDTYMYEHTSELIIRINAEF